MELKKITIEKNQLILDDWELAILRNSMMKYVAIPVKKGKAWMVLQDHHEDAKNLLKILCQDDQDIDKKIDFVSNNLPAIKKERKNEISQNS